MLIYKGCGKWYRIDNTQLVPNPVEKEIVIEHIFSFKSIWNVSTIKTFDINMVPYSGEHDFFILDNNKLQAHCNWTFLPKTNKFLLSGLAIELDQLITQPILTDSINFILSRKEDRNPELIAYIMVDLVQRDTIYKLIKLFQTSSMKITHQIGETHVRLQYNPVNVLLAGPISLHHLTSNKYDRNVYIFGDVHIKDMKCPSNVFVDNTIFIPDFIDQEIKINNKTIDLYVEHAYLTKNNELNVPYKESFLKDVIVRYSKCLSLDKTGCGYGNYFRAHYVDIRAKANINTPTLGSNLFIAIMTTLEKLSMIIDKKMREDEIIQLWNKLVLYNVQLWEKLFSNEHESVKTRNSVNRYIKTLSKPIDFKEAYYNLTKIDIHSFDLYNNGKAIRHMEFPAPLDTDNILDNYAPIMKELSRYTRMEDILIRDIIYNGFTYILRPKLIDILNTFELYFSDFESLFLRWVRNEHSINSHISDNCSIFFKKLNSYNVDIVDAYTVSRIFKPITMPDKTVTYAKNIIIYLGYKHAVNISDFLKTYFKFTITYKTESFMQNVNLQCLDITDLQRPLF